MGALVVVIVIGLVIFAFDVIANIAGNQRSHRNKAIPAPRPRSEGKVLESPDTDYKFHKLPYAVQGHYEFRDFKYNSSPYRYYKAYPGGVAQKQAVSWSPLSKRYRGRVHAPRESVQLAELVQFRTASAFSLAKQIEHDIARAEEAIGNYPVDRPHTTGSLAPPHKPKQFELEKMLSATEIERLSIKETEYVRGYLEAQHAKAKAEYDTAFRQFINAKQQTERRLDDAFGEWERASRQWDEAIKLDLIELGKLKDQLQSAYEVEEIAKLALASAPLPVWMPAVSELSFDKESGILIVEHQFPHFEDVEWVKEVALKRSTSLKPITITERKKAKAAFEPLLTLSLATMLARQFEPDEVAMVAVNGWVDFRSKSTGAAQRAFCASVAAPATKLSEIDLEFADPVTAFHSLKGATTPSLELAPVAPKVRLNVDDKRFVAGRDILEGMEQDENLASMDWEDFEHLCRELFQKVFASEGATVSVTQASRDQGVDAVIFDPDPIRGGKIVIQAKRYVNTVDVSAVRDLWGVVSHEGAMKGLLVTTSQFGPDSYAFAQGKPLTLISGSELLHLLERNGYSFRINLEEARQIQREMGTPPFTR